MAVRCHAGSSRRQGHSVLDFLLASLGLRPLPPWRGKVGMGGEKHGLGTPLVFTPTLALPRLRGREKTDRRGSRKLHDPASGHSQYTDFPAFNAALTKA